MAREELWRPVEGFDGQYLVSNCGRIKTIKKVVTIGSNGGKFERPEKILYLGKAAGYYKVELCKDGIQSSHYVHRLEATAFLPNPENKPCINHKDGDKLNLDIDNLEWATYSENLIHAIKLGLHKPVRFIGKRSLENRRKISEHRKAYWQRKKNEQKTNLGIN